MPDKEEDTRASGVTVVDTVTVHNGKPETEAAAKKRKAAEEKPAREALAKIKGKAK